MRATAHAILVTPTGDDSETEKGRLVVVQNSGSRPKIYRGVVEHVGCHVADDIKPGDVLHYNAYETLGEKHIIPEQHALAWESEDA